MREEYRGLPYHAPRKNGSYFIPKTSLAEESVACESLPDREEETANESYPDGSAVHECWALPRLKAKKGRNPR